jgi:hypothetical protein
MQATFAICEQISLLIIRNKLPPLYSRGAQILSSSTKDLHRQPYVLHMQLLNRSHVFRTQRAQ